MHNKNSTHSYPLPGYTFSPTLFLHPGFRIKTEHHLSAISLPTPLDLREHCFVLSACVVLVFDQVREIVRDPSTLRFRFVETVYQRFTKQDYARKFDLWSVACCIFITECSSFIYEFVVIFPAYMWKNRLLNLGRSGQRGVHLLILTSIFRSWSLALPYHLFLFSALRPLLYNRLYSSESVPKITTHYTIVPRETDPRWKGIS